MGDRDRVVDRSAVPAVRLAVVDGEEVDEVCDEPADRPRRAQPLLHGRGRHRMVRDVQADHGRVDSGVKDGLRRLGVGPDVELRSRCHVALARPHRPSGRCDRCWRRPCARGSRATFVSGPVGTSVTEAELAAIVRSMKSTACSPSGARFGRRERRAVEAALAVDVGGDRELARQRSVGARRHRNVLRDRRGRVRGGRSPSSSPGSGCRGRSSPRAAPPPGSRARAARRSRRRARGRSRG